MKDENNAHVIDGWLSDGYQSLISSNADMLPLVKDTGHMENI